MFFDVKSTEDLTLELGINEFTDNTDQFGLFSTSEGEPYNFLTVKRDERRTHNKEYASISITLSPIKHIHERSAFTLM